MVSRQVLADERGHLQHVETRHGEDRLQRTVGLDDPPLVELVHRTEMCHGDDARDVNPVEINLVEEELRHTAGCDARNPSPFGGRGNEGSMIVVRSLTLTETCSILSASFFPSDSATLCTRETNAMPGACRAA